MRLSDRARNVSIDAVTGLLAGGLCRMLDAAGTVLAELPFDAPAFMPALGGEAESLPLKPDEDCKATGRAVRYQAVSKDSYIVYVADLAAPVDIVQPGICECAGIVYRQPSIKEP